MRSLSYIQDCSTTPYEEVNLYGIAYEMRQANLPDEFIASAIKTALRYEGVCDLVKMWQLEEDSKECDEIIADIQELIDDCAKCSKETFTAVKLNDLDAIASQIRPFKDSLLKIVDEKGGISHLSQLTHIPQPSLSRFFNSNAMPRRTTLLKIASALNIDKVEINPFWIR